MQISSEALTFVAGVLAAGGTVIAILGLYAKHRVDRLQDVIRKERAAADGER